MALFLNNTYISVPIFDWFQCHLSPSCFILFYAPQKKLEVFCKNRIMCTFALTLILGLVLLYCCTFLTHASIFWAFVSCNCNQHCSNVFLHFCGNQ
ncbi:hypothetical protein GDO81_017901 [Engystomops pustulosus]|uniref:Uncharacterized protein n=1 Tax=Engystomops pustulosus TaxID=76066 RepID=A0AAV7AD57_ENGPU|nr:hypothetical protein GDO81_017901 [Engystomops pustulosus]